MKVVMKVVDARGIRPADADSYIPGDALNICLKMRARLIRLGKPTGVDDGRTHRRLGAFGQNARHSLSSHGDECDVRRLGKRIEPRPAAQTSHFFVFGVYGIDLPP